MGGHEQLCLECGEPFHSSRSDAITCSSRCRSRRSRRLRWRQLSPTLRWRDVEADPNDPMFSRLHVAFISDPDAPETEQTLGAEALFWLNDRLGEVVSVHVYAGRGGDGPPLLALDATGELCHKHLSNGEDVYQVGDSCSFLLPLDAAEDAKMDDGQLTVDLDLETWITVYAAGGDGLPEE